MAVCIIPMSLSVCLSIGLLFSSQLSVLDIVYVIVSVVYTMTISPFCFPYTQTTPPPLPHLLYYDFLFWFVDAYILYSKVYSEIPLPLTTYTYIFLTIFVWVYGYIHTLLKSV